MGQADAFGLYAIHYAAMNENEVAPDILGAILSANRFAAQQRDRFGSLALHYACRNRGPTSRQDSVLKIHSSMQPCVHRMVRLLLNNTSGYPLAAGVADMDGALPVDYCLVNPNARLDSTTRSLKMLLFVNAESVALTVHKSELVSEDGGSKLKVSLQCPGFNWQRLFSTYSKPIIKSTAKMLCGLPIAYGHDGRGRTPGTTQEGVPAVTVLKDLIAMSPYSVYIKIVFKEWRRVCRDRLGIKSSMYEAAETAIKSEKQRAFGRATAMIKELNDVTERVIKHCTKLETQEAYSKHVMRWFSMSGNDADDCHTLYHALNLLEETWTPIQALSRVIEDSMHTLVSGRRGLFFNLPHDAVIAMERHPLHSVVQNESLLAPVLPTSPLFVHH